MNTLRILSSWLVVILPLFLPYFSEKISLKTKLTWKGWIFISIIFIIVCSSITNLLIEKSKSEETDKTQKETQTNTYTILNKVDTSLKQLEIVSNRMEELTPRLDSLEKRTIKSITKIDKSFKLVDRYDSLQMLKLHETEPIIDIDSVSYIFDTTLKCYLIKIDLSNIGGRNASKVKPNVHFFYLDDNFNLSSDRRLDIDRFNEENVVPKNLKGEYKEMSVSNGGYKVLKNGVVQIIITYYDDLLKKNHSIIKRYYWNKDKTFDNLRFKSIPKINNEILERYIKDKKIEF